MTCDELLPLSTCGVATRSTDETAVGMGPTTPALGPRTPLTNGMTFQTDGLTVVTLASRARTAASVPAARSRAAR